MATKSQVKAVMAFVLQGGARKLARLYVGKLPPEKPADQDRLEKAIAEALDECLQQTGPS